MLPLENLDASKKKGATTPVTVDSLPGMIPGLPKGAWDASKYKIRYRKFNLDDLAEVAELEQIETRAIQDRGVYVLSTKDFIFMDKIFMMIKYVEKIDDEDPRPAAVRSTQPRQESGGLAPWEI